MKRVLITFTPDYYPSNTGFAQAFVHLHKSIIENGVCDHVYVIAEGEYQSPDDSKISVLNVPPMKGRGYLLSNKYIRFFSVKFAYRYYREAFKKVENVCQTDKVQMILLESMFMAWLIPIIKKRFSTIPVVCRIHGSGPEYTAFYKKRRHTKYYEYALDCVFKSSYVAVTTKFYLDFFRDYYKDYGKFIDRDFFILPNTTIENSNKKTQEKVQQIEILQLGRMDRLGYHQKGFQDTIKALMYIEEIEPELASKIVYTTIGGGEREEEFLQHAKCLSIVSHNHYTHLANEKVKEIENRTDVVLIPSRCEGMSMFGTEAIAAGKPIIGTKGNGLEAICYDGYNGYLVTEYDYIRLAEAIIKISKFDNERQRMSENSRKLYENNCSYKTVAIKYNLIVRCLNKKP